MSDLTEFLLARIAEDEASLPEGFDCWYPPERYAAECEAKRRIVEDFEILHADYGVTHDPSTEARRFQALIAAARLASVYADHPDYREEWTP